MNKLLGTFIVIYIMIYDYNKYIKDKIKSDNILCYCKQVQSTSISNNSFIDKAYGNNMC